jgi:hypothetical protein
MLRKTRKNLPWKGWSREKPGFHQRTIMLKKCGRKCFLGPGKSFPICKKNTCKISKKGVYAAYVRAKEWGNRRSTYKNRKGSRPKYSRSIYTKIASKSRKLIKRLFK